MVSSEAAPFAKTGGLADVVGALPLALRAFGDEVAVVIPRYGSIDLKNARRVWDNLPVHLGPDAYSDLHLSGPGRISRLPGRLPAALRPQGLLRRIRHWIIRTTTSASPSSAAPRWASPASSSAPTSSTATTGRPDWSPPTCAPPSPPTRPSSAAGPSSPSTTSDTRDCSRRPRSPEVGLDPGVYRPDGMEFFGRVSYIKAGIEFADALNTVSPTYAREIQTPEYGFGLDGALRARAAVLTRHPQRRRLRRVESRHRPAHPRPLLRRRPERQSRSASGNCSRNSACPPEAMDRPLLGIVSRFTRQKGTDLLAEIAAAIGGRRRVPGGAWARAIRSTRRSSAACSRSIPGRIAVRIGFDNGLAHRIEAGADIFLMPSRYEPCGLNQIYSLRYGTVPVVRATGGLDDTIEEGTGFKFAEYSGQALLEAVRAAVRAFADREALAADDAARHAARIFPGRRRRRPIRRLYRRLLARLNLLAPSRF